MKASGSLPFARPDSDAAILIRGPPMTGKFDLLCRLLAAAGHGILLSTGKPADRVRDAFGAYGDPNDLAIVDCVTRARRRDPEHDERTRFVSSPQNLTELGVKFTDLADAVEDRDDVVVGIHSLSELLVYRNVQHVYRFLRVLLGEVRGFDWGAVGVIDDSAFDEQTVDTIGEPFDGVVTTREGETGREARLRLSAEPDTDWTTF